MSDEDKVVRKDGLGYQEASAVKSLLAPLKWVELLGQRISRGITELSASGGNYQDIQRVIDASTNDVLVQESAEKHTPQFQKPSISTRFGTIIRDLGLCGDTKDYDEDE